MKKFIIIFLCLYALAFGAYYYFHVLAPSSQTPSKPDNLVAAKTTPLAAPTPIPAPRTFDVDAMAARMKDHQDVYKRIRDASLKVYAASTKPGKHDAINADTIRMGAYLWVWDDYYGEGLWQSVQSASDMEWKDGTVQMFPLVDSLRSIGFMRNRYCKAESTMDSFRDLADKLDGSDYPVEFKMWAWLQIARILSKSSSHPETKSAMAQSYATLPYVVKKTAEYYQALIKEGLPDDLLYAKGYACLDDVEDNTDAFVQMGAELDKAFEAEAPNSPVRLTLQAAYDIDYAWMARGNGYADTVTEEGNRLMQERLAKAGEILEAAYVKYPDHAPICRSMLRVELGQGQGMSRMETWFQRAIKADPDDYDTYQAKAYYLLPRWYGTPEGSWAFGMDCVQTQNWRAKLPMILVYTADDLVNTKNDRVLEAPAIWAPLEKVFRDWLERYPESTIYRSKFVKYAALGKHWDVVKEQCAILGDNWDRDVFDGTDYPALKKMAEEQSDGK